MRLERRLRFEKAHAKVVHNNVSIGNATPVIHSTTETRACNACERNQAPFGEAHAENVTGVLCMTGVPWSPKDAIKQAATIVAPSHTLVSLRTAPKPKGW